MSGKPPNHTCALPIKNAAGRIVRLKTITEACQQSAVQVVEEDEDGTVVNLSLHNVTTGSRRLKTRYGWGWIHTDGDIYNRPTPASHNALSQTPPARIRFRFPPHAHSELNKLYPVGTRLAVKSPYLKIYTAGAYEPYKTKPLNPDPWVNDLGLGVQYDPFI